MSKKILVIGALGNVGAEVIKQLLIRGQDVRAADLSMEKIRECFGETVEAVPFNFADKDTYSSTFENVESMFLMRPPQISDVKQFLYPALDFAQSAGVKNVVFLSLIGIEKVKFVPHYKVEAYLKKSSMTWTFLRCSFFMQNLNTTHRQEILENSELFIPVGNAKTSLLDVRDIGQVASVALTESGHENKMYDLTGSEAIDYWQVALILSEVLGRKITYRKPSLLRFLLSRIKNGTPFIFALVMTGLYLSTRYGMAKTITGEVERITGNKPITFRQYAEDYKTKWL